MLSKPGRWASVVPDNLKHIISDVLFRGQDPEKEKFMDECDGKMSWTVRAFLPGLENDRIQFRKCSEKTKDQLRAPHGYFAISDLVSNSNLREVLIGKEERSIDNAILTIFALNEIRHTETYVTVLSRLFDSLEEMWDYLKKMLEMPSIVNMIRWMNLSDPEDSRGLCPIGALLVQIFSESSFFLFPFNQILFFKHKGLFKTITALNDAIIWDEDKHIVFNILLVKQRIEKNGKTIKDFEDLIINTAKKAYGYAEAFIKDVMSKNEEPGFTMAGNIEQLRYITNLRLKDFDLKPLFETSVKSPFGWNDLASLEGKTNFFEIPVPEYAQNKLFADDIYNRSMLTASSTISVTGSDNEEKKASLPLVSLTGITHNSYMEFVKSMKDISIFPNQEECDKCNS